MLLTWKTVDSAPAGSLAQLACRPLPPQPHELEGSLFIFGNLVAWIFRPWHD
jgi:hypothetical protein